MSTKAQAKTQAKAPAAPAAARIPQLPVAAPEHEVERPDIASQLEGAARLGHSLGALSVDSSAPPIIQCQEIPEEEEEELQMKRESTAIQRQELPEEEAEELMMRPDTEPIGLEGGKVPPMVESAINRARGNGQPLEGTVQAQMSEAMGHDFSDVRVHTNAEADSLNQQLSAKAFTTSRDIFFKRGEYNPGTSTGRKLIAHELSHVVQQSSGLVRGGESGMTVHPAGDAFEQRADAFARKGIAAGHEVGAQAVESGMERHRDVGGAAFDDRERSMQGDWFDPVQRNRHTVMRMAMPPKILEQGGGTCGLYSLCMAIQAIDPTTWMNPKPLLKEILDAALEQGTSVGEEFSVQRIVLLARRLGYEAEIIPFKDEVELGTKLKATGSKGVLVAWAAAEKASLGPVWQNALSAHWSVIAAYDETAQELTIYNPWGVVQRPKLSDFYRWTKQLKQGAPFPFKEFAEKQVVDYTQKARNQGQSLRAYMESHGTKFSPKVTEMAGKWSVGEEVAAVIVNLMGGLTTELTKYGVSETAPMVEKLPERKVNLAGQFVTIQGTGLGPGKRLPMLLHRPYEK